MGLKRSDVYKYTTISLRVYHFGKFNGSVYLKVRGNVIKRWYVPNEIGTHIGDFHYIDVIHTFNYPLDSLLIEIFTDDTG